MVQAVLFLRIPCLARALLRRLLFPGSLLSAALLMLLGDSLAIRHALVRLSAQADASALPPRGAPGGDRSALIVWACFHFLLLLLQQTLKIPEECPA